MGIVNLTDNSFMRSSRMAGAGERQLCERVEGMLRDGADIIDVGACSTAPGTVPVSVEEERERLRKPLVWLFRNFPSATFSFDTFRSAVVEDILAASRGFGGGIIINDISAGQEDPMMLPLVAANSLEYIAMDRTDDPYAFFSALAPQLEAAGIGRWILDPGFGFGKSNERGWEILRDIGRLRDFGRPVLAALSHKRMIWQPLGLTPDSCAERSVEAEKLAASLGADIIRTHDLILHK